MFPLFATGVVYTDVKFAAGVVDTGGNLPPEPLPAVSTALAKLVEKFVVDTVVHLQISPRIFEKI